MMSIPAGWEKICSRLYLSILSKKREEVSLSSKCSFYGGGVNLEKSKAADGLIEQWKGKRLLLRTVWNNAHHALGNSHSRVLNPARSWS